MNIFDTARLVFVAIRSALTKHLSGPEFACGDCERLQRCGRPPTDECAVKLAQLERDPTGHQRRMKARATLMKQGYWP